MTESVSRLTPVDLQRMARSIAASYGDKGAIVITYGPDGVRIGTQGLSAQELQDALCTAIHYNFCFNADLESN